MPLPHLLSGPDLSSWRFNMPKQTQEEIRIVEGDKTAIARISILDRPIILSDVIVNRSQRMGIGPVSPMAP
jgi:hypothetical protein